MTPPSGPAVPPRTLADEQAVVAMLAEVWSRLAEVCGGVGEEQWKAPTEVPGRSVQTCTGQRGNVPSALTVTVDPAAPPAGKSRVATGGASAATTVPAIARAHPAAIPRRRVRRHDPSGTPALIPSARGSASDRSRGTPADPRV